MTREFHLQVAKKLGLQPCEVKIYERNEENPRYYNGKTVRAFFHCWEQYAQPLAPSPMVGGHSGGQVSQMFGIVEDENGLITRAQPFDIRFIREE